MVARNLWIAVVVLAGAAEAGAQDQTVTFTASSSGIIDGGRNGCVGGDWWLQPAFPSITFIWTDTTGAEPGKVRIDVSMRWAFYSQAALDLDVAVNGVSQPEPLTSPSSLPGNCGQSDVTTSTHEEGILAWNALGQNALTLTVPQGQVAVFNTTGAFMVQVQITKLNEAPAAPAQILQHELLNPTIKNKSLPVGGRTVIKGMQFSAVINDPDVGDSIHVEIEIQPTQVFFTGVPTVLGAPVTVTAEATPVLINVPNLVDGAYHWQVRTVDAAGEASPWVSFGANSEVLADFTIDSAALSVPPLDFEDHGSGDCTLTAGVMPRLAPGLALILAALLVRIRRAARA